VTAVVSCTHCGKQLRVKEELLGKKAKCPKCQQLFTLKASANGSSAVSGAGSASRSASGSAARSASGSAARSARTAGGSGAAARVVSSVTQNKAEWRVQTGEGEEYGPVTKAELDQWAAEERIDSQCQLLKEGWDQWKWADEVYPDLAKESEAEPPQGAQASPDNPFAAIGQSAPAAPAAAASNPFASPQSSPRQDAAGVNVQSSGGGELSRVAVVSLNRSRTWTITLSIVGFIGGGFLVIVGIIYLIGFFQILGMSRGRAPGGAIAFLLFNVLTILTWAVTLILTSVFLLIHSGDLGEAARRRDMQSVERALQSEAKIWKIRSILALSVFGLILIVVIIAMSIGMSPKNLIR